MTTVDELDYDRAARRIRLFMGGIAGVGTVAALALWGWRAGAGFFIGSLLSTLNFFWLKGMVDAMGGARPRRSTAALAGRYLLLGVVAYVIFRLSPVSVPALLAGIFVLTAAVFVEVVVEIVYARK